MSKESDDSLEAFFDATKQGFRRAREQSGATFVSLVIAERPVRIHVAGSQLLSLLRPLAHLLSSEALNSHLMLEIFAWDGPANWLPPRPCWTLGQQSPLGEITGLDSKRFAIYYHDQSGLLCMLDRASGQALYWLASAPALPFWEKGAPFRILFHWWASSIGGHMAHAAAVGIGSDGLLLVGRGGSGKSSLTLACIDAGMRVAGDDYVLLTADPAPTAHSLYSSAKIHTGFLNQAFPHWKDQVAERIGPEAKALLLLQECKPSAIKRSFAIQGVVIPRVNSAEEAQLSICRLTDALLALAPSTIFQLPGAQATALPFFRQWASRLPAYVLTAGSEISQGPRLLRELLQELDAPEKPSNAGAMGKFSDQSQVDITSMSQPRVSVVIPVFNGARFLAEAVESVRRQACSSIEIIIVDDGSTDDSVKIAKSLPDAKLICQSNAGAAMARNAGIAQAQGHYVAFLDADDLWPDDKLSLQFEALHRAPGAQIIAGRVEEFGSGSQLDSSRLERRSGDRAYTIGAMLIRREDFMKVGLLNSALRFGEFMDWHSRAIAMGFKEMVLDAVVLKRRVHDHNTTRSAGTSRKDYLVAIKLHLDRKRAPVTDKPGTAAMETQP